MPRFNFTAKVRNSDGSSETATGTVESPSPIYGKARARVDASNDLRKQLKPGQTVDGNDVDVQYSAHQ